MLIRIIYTVIAFIPALIANPSAVLFGGGAPIDGGKKIRGRRILGDGKTWRGLLGGGLAGGFIGMILALMLSPTHCLYPSSLQGIIVVFSLSFGALLGDIGASFVKRRMDISRGEKAPILDQYDFVIGSFLLTLLTSPSWVTDTYIQGEGRIALLILLIAVPALHRIVNILGHRLGLKDEPW